MTSKPDDSGTINVLLERLNTQRLPRALRMREKVEKGEVLDDYDMLFLKKVFQDVRHTRSLVLNHPELHQLASKLIDLYAEITEKALQNQKRGS